MFLIIPNSIVTISSIFHICLLNIVLGSFFKSFIHMYAQLIIYIITKGNIITINTLFLIACFKSKFISEKSARVIPHPGQYKPVIL